MVTSHDIDVKRRIKDACNIVDYIGREFQLRRQGATYVCHCPFHDDKRPSLQINPVRQSWACWVCNLRGDIFSWVMRRENVGFREALEQLAEFTGVELTQAPRRYEKQSAEDKQWLYKAARWAEEEFHKMLLDSEAATQARDYLNDRGISQQSVEDFQLGFSPASFTWLVDRAANSPFSAKVLEAIGLIATSQRGSWYDRFRGRLIFPIRDTSQRTIAFGGRVVPGLFPPDQEPPGKYINSPETRLFSKSETLYALNLVRDVIARDKVRRLTVVEGYTDVIGAWQTGMKNAVACLGTALNERHLRVIRRFADQITLVLDGDDAGQRRANEILDLFVSNDVDLRILTLPEGLDPFDYVMENGSEPFQNMIDSAPDAIEHRIRSETAGVDVLNDTHNANQALERILQTIARAPASLVSGSAAKRIRQDQIL
ncbi:MAG: DNA primase, partial [Planctomycetota bacterium]